MDKLAAVRFNNISKAYYFSTDLDLVKGDKVVVETIRGLELGELITDLKEKEDFDLGISLKPIKRKANRADLEVYDINKIKAEQSFAICKDIVKEMNMDMRMISCEYTLDASKVIFMYTADERVDFRDLLKRLASVFKCRIELRQIGPRDKAKIIGGFGTCGMPLCCASFLGEFDGVSINMAKNQLLAINIDKISGACGRLLCCLKYEDAAYKELRKEYPKIGLRCTFDDKPAKVIGLNVLARQVKMDNDGKIVTVSLEEFNDGKSKQQDEKKDPIRTEMPKDTASEERQDEGRSNNRRQKGRNNRNRNQNSQPQNKQGGGERKAQSNKNAKKRNEGQDQKHTSEPRNKHQRDNRNRNKNQNRNKQAQSGQKSQDKPVNNNADAQKQRSNKNNRRRRNKNRNKSHDHNTGQSGNA